MRILLLSAYDADSHRYWREGLVAHFPQHQWQVLHLPPRYFAWRVRGNSLSWAFNAREILEQDYDVLIATSMCDLSALRGMVPAVARIPTLLYFHENQFDYPDNPHQKHRVEAQVLSLYSALCADQLVFNSSYNQHTFLQGVQALIKKLPDAVPKGLNEQLAQKSLVLPVPLHPAASTRHAEDKASTPLHSDWIHRWQCHGAGTPLRIVWASRWEHDKGPDRLLAALRELEKRDVGYKLCLLGKTFRSSPQEFDVIKTDFAHRLVHAGYAETRVEYLGWLSTANVIFSTSVHEFQGIAVLEAIQLGCTPLLPHRMSYPELVPPEYLYSSYMEDVEMEAKAASDAIQRQSRKRLPPPPVSRYEWPALHQAYKDLLKQVVDS